MTGPAGTGPTVMLVCEGLLWPPWVTVGPAHDCLKQALLLPKTQRLAVLAEDR